MDNQRQVLDMGYVRLLHIMGDDFMACRAARTSYLSEAKSETDDKRLLSYLYKNGHMSPFEFTQLVWELYIPNVISTHFLRHRAFSFNSQSGRYTEYSDDFYIPDEWRKQSKTNKQGSDGTLAFPEFLSADLAAHVQNSMNLYKEALRIGVSKEMARFFLPTGISYHKLWMRTDLRNLLHFFDLRTAANAQYETREYANAMLDITEDVLPYTIELWRESKENA